MSTGKGTKFFLAVLLCLVMSVPAFASTIHVTENGAGDKSGDSWENAASDLRDVLNKARGGDEIWVAKGRYEVSNSDKFEFKYSGVKLYGGFSGDETDRSKRDWIKNETILAGGASHSGAAVVMASSCDGIVLDGFTVTDGKTEGVGSGGFGIYASKVSVANCVFDGNTGGISVVGGSGATLPEVAVTNCAFTNNGDYRGVYVSTGSTTVSNSTFSGNKGGITVSGTCSLVVVNCTFSENQSTNGNKGDAIFMYSGTAVVTNSIFWGNKGNTSDIYLSAGGTLGIHNSVIKLERLEALGTVESSDIKQADPALRTRIVNGRIYYYGLGSGSSAASNGLAVGSHNIGGVTITVPDKDQMGQARPASPASVDIGSCEGIGPAPKPVSRISVIPTTATMQMGEDRLLTALIEPEDADDKTVVWQSSSTDIATVDSSGWVKAVGTGNAVITAAASNDRTVSASCSVTVLPGHVTGISIDKVLSLGIGTKHTLSARLEPKGATAVLTWTSSVPAVATVNQNTGEVTGIKAGEAVIHAHTKGASDNEITSNPCAVTVADGPVVLVDKIILSEQSLSMTSGDSRRLTYRIEPADATAKTVTWSSSNGAAVTVNTDGVIKAVGGGSAVITAKANDSRGVTATCTVTVTHGNRPVTGVSINRTSLNISVGSSAGLTAVVAPSDATDKSVIWQSGNSAVATVNGGVVTGIAQGIATVTVRTTDGGYTAMCIVTVTPQPIKPEPQQPRLPPGTPGAITPAKPNVTEVSYNATPEERAAAIEEAASTMVGIDKSALEVNVHRQVAMKSEMALSMAEAAIKTVNKTVSVDTVLPLPVFVAKPATSGGVVAVGFIMTGEELKNDTPHMVRVMKVLPGGRAEFFTYKSRAAEFGDRTFTVQDMNDNIFTGKFVKSGKYQLVLFVKDGAQFDVDGALNKSVTDPAVVVGTNESAPVPTPTPTPSPRRSSSGGCNASFGAAALVILAPILIKVVKNRR